MNTAQTILQMYGIPYAVQQFEPAIAAQLVINPALTDAQLVADEDGTLKHFVRGKIGFFVDFVWPAVEPELDSILALAVANVRANAAVASTVAENPIQAPESQPALNQGD